MLKEKKKTNKNKGSYILCKNCHKRIYINDEDVKENTTIIAKKLIYDCECGEQVILE